MKKFAGQRILFGLLGGFFFFPTGALAFDDGDSLFGYRPESLGAAEVVLSEERFRRLEQADYGLSRKGARQWKVLVEMLSNQPLRNRLSLVQTYFSLLPYQQDRVLYGVDDYWATVGEVLANGGDCEDHSLAKYRLLLDSGVDMDLMRLVLVEDTVTGEAHAFLKVIVEGEALILDNRYKDVISVDYATTYRPLYAMNARKVWAYRNVPLMDSADGRTIVTAAE